MAIPAHVPFLLQNFSVAHPFFPQKPIQQHILHCIAFTSFIEHQKKPEFQARAWIS